MTMTEQERRRLAHAANTWVAETPRGVIILAHPGQELNRDPEYLRRHHGIVDVSTIKRLSESKERPLSADEKIVAQAEAEAAGEAEQEARAEALAKARVAAKGGARNTAKPSPAPVTAAGDRPPPAA